MKLANDDFERAMYHAHRGIAAALGVPDWEYRDFPNMLPEYWQLLQDFIDPEEMRIFVYSEREWPDGNKTIRGQVFISPKGLENLRVNSVEYYKDNQP